VWVVPGGRQILDSGRNTIEPDDHDDHDGHDDHEENHFDVVIFVNFVIVVLAGRTRQRALAHTGKTLYHQALLSRTTWLSKTSSP
jgi:hypothetical protein